jgi:hypothetical protein
VLNQQLLVSDTPKDVSKLLLEFASAAEMLTQVQ